MNSIEQELMMMLRRLPVPITMTWRDGLYHWQCRQGSGASPRLVSATEGALCFFCQTPISRLGVQEQLDLNEPGVVH